MQIDESPGKVNKLPLFDPRTLRVGLKGDCRKRPISKGRVGANRCDTGKKCKWMKAIDFGGRVTQEHRAGDWVKSKLSTHRASRSAPKNSITVNETGLLSQ
jgi:hypothetical protein